jgi:hypothetical protein
VVDFEFQIYGETASNNALYMCVCPGAADQDLTKLVFVQDVFGDPDPLATDITIEWYLEWGGYNHAGSPVVTQAEMRVYPDPVTGCIYWEMPKCDHWWYLWGRFAIWYHIPDGYYYMYYSIVPAPVL